MQQRARSRSGPPVKHSESEGILYGLLDVIQIQNLRLSATKKASGKRKMGINPKTGRPYARRKTGMVQAECCFCKTVKQIKHKTVTWPAQLMHMKDGIYRCRITSKGKHIVVRDLENELY